MAAVMLPVNAMQRQPRRCVTVMDIPYVVGTPVGTPAATNAGMQSPTSVRASASPHDFVLNGRAGSYGIPTPQGEQAYGTGSWGIAGPQGQPAFGTISWGTSSWGMPTQPRQQSFDFTGSCGIPELAGLPLAERHSCGGRPAMRRAHTMDVTRVAAQALANADGFMPVDPVSPQGKENVRRRTQRSKTMGAQRFESVSVSVVAPGGGTGINAQVYADLSRMDGFEVAIKGQSRAPYDRYPIEYGGDGAPPPNLGTFAMDLLSQGLLETTDCLVVGSRGGQVVLPTLWRARGDDVPPAVVMNGGCAMGTPVKVHWPDTAVTFLLLGGQDYFKKNHSNDSYLADCQSRVPRSNASTAILFVNEMAHMPQAELLMAILHHMIIAATSWKRNGEVPQEQFKAILAALNCGRWSGSFTFKASPGGIESWQGCSLP